MDDLHDQGSVRLDYYVKEFAVNGSITFIGIGPSAAARGGYAATRAKRAIPGEKVARQIIIAAKKRKMSFSAPGLSGIMKKEAGVCPLKPRRARRDAQGIREEADAIC